jgi:hypothetical protein
MFPTMISGFLANYVNVATLCLYLFFVGVLNFLPHACFWPYCNLMGSGIKKLGHQEIALLPYTSCMYICTYALLLLLFLLFSSVLLVNSMSDNDSHKNDTVFLTCSISLILSIIYLNMSNVSNYI